MLQIQIPDTELFNDQTQEFMYVKACTLNLEHSLISVSKWESKYCKPFVSNEPKTIEETRYYIKCMTINKNVDPNVYLCITNDVVDKVNAYIDAPMTATKIFDLKSEGHSKPGTVTSELIYYWMIQGNVPVEFEKWHLNRLLTLIRVIGIKNNPKAEKMRGRELLEYQTRENERRRKALGTKG